MVACMTANLTVAGLLEEAAERLRASIAAREPSATPELDAQLLLAHVLAVPRTRLKSHPEERPHPSRIEEYRRLLARHAAGEPVAYLTGYRHFWSLRLAVTPAVLIPRPETELLVERVDLIVSNPPYVAADDPAMRAPALAHEPRAALTPGLEALASLREIVRGAPAHLARAGWLLLEHGATQGTDVREALVLAGFRYVRSHPDLAGHERVTEGQAS